MTAVAEVVKTLAAPDAAMVKRLLEQGMMIPAQPRVLGELRKRLSNEDFDIRSLTRLINSDPGIVAMLFKACNNAAYRQHGELRSVERILQTIGIQQVYNLVQAIAVASLQDNKQNREAYEAFWVRSQAIGQLCMLVAESRVSVCGIPPDQAYLAGMFHDCGVPLLMRRFPTYCAEMQLSEPGRWIELSEEDKKFSADHCVVGYLIAKHWGLPDFICDAIHNHHEIGRIGGQESRSMVAILQMAMHLYYGDQSIPDYEWDNVCEDVLIELGLHDDSLHEFMDIILEQFHEQNES